MCIYHERINFNLLFNVSTVMSPLQLFLTDHSPSVFSFGGDGAVFSPPALLAIELKTELFLNYDLLKPLLLALL